MATIIPFSAWRYDSKSVPIERVVAPPYDIISPDEQEALYSRDPHNVIRVELTKEDKKSGLNKYELAAKIWGEWIQKGVITQDEESSYYLYKNQFQDPETKSLKSRVVIFGAFKLEPFETRVILPHEKTHSKAKEDRYQLLQATKTNFSPVFGLYEDQSKLIQTIAAESQKAKQAISFSLEGGESHELWKINDPKQVAQIQKMFERKSILIADGHHRYETALNYWKDQKSPKSSVGYCLMGLVELSDEGLLIFPIHRLVKNVENVILSRFEDTTKDPRSEILRLTPQDDRFSKAMIAQLSRMFDCKKVDDQTLDQVARGKLRGGFGLRFCDGAYFLKVKDQKLAQAEMPAGKPAIWYQLEVAQVSHLVLKPLGVHEKNIEEHIEYTKSVEEAIQKVRSGEISFSVVVPPIQAKVMQAICSAGELMPQKSTYFYPKLGSGILMYQHSQD